MRFGPIKIFEFYGSTEGNVVFFNYTNKIGAVGRTGIFSKVRYTSQPINLLVNQEKKKKKSRSKAEEYKEEGRNCLETAYYRSNAYYRSKFDL